MTAIYGSSPWTREAVRNLTPDELDQIDEILPDHLFVTVGAARQPGNWTISLMEDRQQVARVTGVHNLVNGVRAAVRLWEDADAG